MIKIAVIGGASGVGKTTLLNTIPKLKLFNTGSFFKTYMGLHKRDDVRKGDWSVYERDVIKDITKSVIASFEYNQKIVIKTHFAAKIYDKKYRIGLKKNLIHSFGKKIFSHSLKCQMEIIVDVILIASDPYSLLYRRKMDTTRERAPVLSDCLKALRVNEIYSRYYYSELSRAEEKVFEVSKDRVHYHVIENENLGSATKTLKEILMGHCHSTDSERKI